MDEYSESREPAKISADNSEVMKELGILQDAIEQHGERLNKLGERLSLIVTPGPNKPGDPKNPKTEEQLCPLAERIRSLRRTATQQLADTTILLNAIKL